MGGSPSSATFPPSIVVQVKALACELPHRRGLPLSRFSLADIRQEVLQQGLVAEISGATIWRWLSKDAIHPWRYRTWIFPRDPRFVEKAGPILDLYQGLWQGQPLRPRDFVLSADEKTSIQARHRRHPSLPPAPGKPARLESEYTREGAWVYLAAWDVRRAKVFGRCVRKNGIEPFDALIGEVMGQEPYRSAERVFWIFDNGSSHRGQKCVQRRATAGFTTGELDGYGLCSHVPARPPPYASDPVFVHRLAPLFRASFRPRLAASVISPLRFAITSRPSRCEEDFHLQAVKRARHTPKSARLEGGRYKNRDAKH
jgi:hypothetical protein